MMLQRFLRSTGELSYKFQRFSTSINKFSTMYRPPTNNVDQLLSEQDHLPKLPVPDLRQTMDKYIASVTPHLTAEQLETTKEAVRTFLEENGDGERLQKKLKERADKLDNWLVKWWTDLAYLSYRESILINSSPTVIYPRENVPHTMNEALQYAAKFIVSSALYYHSLAEGKLPFSMKVPTCRAQLPSFYGSARVPDTPADRFVVHPYLQTQHVIVVHNSQFFKLPVYHTDGRLLSLSELLRQLISIVEASPADLTPSLDECVGLLTSEHRDVWAPLYKKLKQDTENSASIQAIESALTMICLDKPCSSLVRDGYETLEQSHDGDRTHMFDEATDKDYETVSQRVLYGTSTADNSTNRWNDKLFQVCVSPDMGCGCLLEHSSIDGAASISLTNFNLSFVEKNRAPIVACTRASLPPFQRLKWNLDGELKSAILKAGQRLNADAARLQVRCLSYFKFGKNALKAKRLSTDGFIQVAIQLAFRHLHNRNPVTYESVSTAIFREGRTDTIRSCTMETDAFVSAMEDTQRTDQECCTLFLAAITKHAKLAVEGSQGQAFDRHLLGLRVLAMADMAANASSGGDSANSVTKIPAVFEDIAYGKLQHIDLSTSQVVSSFDTRYCFGPVAPDGYGIAYRVAENHINFTMTCFSDCSTTDIDALCSGIHSSLDRCYELLRLVPTKSNL